jgi:hypothetical protein
MFNSVEELKTYLFESGYPNEAVSIAVDVFEMTGDGEFSIQSALRIVNEFYDVEYEKMGDF